MILLLNILCGLLIVLGSGLIALYLFAVEQVQPEDRVSDDWLRGQR